MMANLGFVESHDHVGDYVVPREVICHTGCFLHVEDIFPLRIGALGKTPSLRLLYEVACFSSKIFKFCALDWPLRA